MSVSFFFLALIIIFTGFILFSELLPFLKNYISLDHQITQLGIQWAYALLFPLGSVLLFVGILGFFLARSHRNSTLYRIFQDDLRPMLSSVENSKFNVFMLSTLFTIVFTAIYAYFRRYPGFLLEGGVFEFAQSFILLGSSMLFFSTAFAFRRKNLKGAKYRGVFSLYLLLSFVSFFVGMEEISWGQWIFRWKTPLFMQKINVLNETNIHNLFSARHNMIYYLIATSIILLILLVSIFFRLKPQRTEKLLLISPHPGFFVPISYIVGINFFCVFFIGLPTWHEFQEIVVDFVVLFYALANFYRVKTFFDKKSLTEREPFSELDL